MTATAIRTLHHGTRARPRAARALSAVLAAAGVLVAVVPAAVAGPQAADLVKVDLIAEPAAIRAGEPFWVGIRLKMQEHWHTYWRNPGDSGEPTSVTWRLPQGFAAGELAWPAPVPIRVGPVASYGYEGEAVLLTQITPPRDLRPGAGSEIAAQVSYLVCEKICIPGEANVALTLPSVPAADNAMTNAATRDAFVQARARLPQPSPWTAAFKADAKTVTLTLAAGAMQNAAIREAAFFPHDNTLIVNAAPQALALDASGLRLTLERSQTAVHMPRQIDGVLQVDEDIGGQTVRHAFALSAVPAAGAASGDSAATLLQAVLLALIGGLILNLMPCVFPVLSLKILHLTQHAGETRKRVRLHGLAYTFGILASFALLAGVLFAVRAGGAEIGWGFQLQSPAVVAALAFVLFAMSLSLSGVLQFGASMTRIGGMLMHAPGLSGSFFAGVLATVVATPCTAPFMGAAIGFALTQPFALALAVFLALGFGLALPFLALSFAPVLLRRLPRPGAWMETLKQALAFPLYATVVWLIWVLSQQVGPAGLLAALSGLVLIAFAAWVLSAARGRRDALGRTGQGFAAVALAALVLLLAAIGSDRPAESSAQATPAPSGAEAFTQAKLDALLTQDRPVFVNMTAAWCITCMVNERTALSTQSVRDAFAQKGIAYLKGDWTNRNPEITRLLEKFGRSGVPLYVLYNRGQDPVVLPQLLTESAVLEQLARI